MIDAGRSYLIGRKEMLPFHLRCKTTNNTGNKLPTDSNSIAMQIFNPRPTHFPISRSAVCLVLVRYVTSSGQATFLGLVLQSRQQHSTSALLLSCGKGDDDRLGSLGQREPCEQALSITPSVIVRFKPGTGSTSQSH